LRLNPVEWPKTGLGVEDALRLVEGEVHRGFVPVLPDSVFCLRRMQALGYPIRIIAVKDPVFIIGLVEAGSLPSWLRGFGGVAWVALYRTGLDCVTHTRHYSSVGDGLRQLEAFKRALADALGLVKLGELPIQVVDRSSAADAIVPSTSEDNAIVVSDSFSCIWQLHRGGEVRRVFIIEKPLLLVAVTGPEVGGERKAPAVLMMDEDGDDCLMGGFARRSGVVDDHRDAYRRFLRGLLKAGPLNVPLELVIKAGDLVFRNLDKQRAGG